MTTLLLVLLVALAFEYINGFHDAANAIATVVSTRVLTPRQAIALAAVTNLIGAFIGVGVAKTISSGLVIGAIPTSTILAALLGGVIWNLLTWWLGLPSSSSHALIGGLCGAALAAADGDWGVLLWSSTDAAGHHIGLWPKVVMPMLISPLVGFCIAAILMTLLYIGLRKVTPRVVNLVFGKAQVISAGLMGLSHGSNDAQKTMGIMTLALFAAQESGSLASLPFWAGFLHQTSTDVPGWVIVSCALTMAAGTAGGGWRIIRTMGHKMVKLQPVHGFAAETSAATVILTASYLKIPLSTTHVISTSIMGVGSIKRLSAVKWGVVGRIVWAWVLTIPIAGLLGYGIDKLLRAFGMG
ncbi:MAG: inorganic phosphate transporter [Opitutaceae bacterium]